MSDSTISQLPVALTITGTELIPVDQGGVTKRAALTQLGIALVIVAPGKMLYINNTLTFAGTDGTIFTFPTTSASLARTDAAQTFTGTQTFGAITCTTINGETITPSGGTFSLATGKTFTVNNTLTLAGTDGVTITLPTTSATMARTDSAQTFSGLQVFTGGITTPAQIASTVSTGTAPLVVASTTPVANLSIGGNAATSSSTTGNAATATALANARTIDGVSFDGTANITVVAPATHATSPKTTPVDADEIPLADSASSFALAKLTWADLKAGILSLFSISSGSSLIGFLQAGTGAVLRTLQDKNRDAVSVFDFMTIAEIADWKSGAFAIDHGIKVQVAVNYCNTTFAGPVYLPPGNPLFSTAVELNDQTATGGYRPAVRILGAGKIKTRILWRGAGGCFRHTLTQSQGDNSYFTRGLEVSHVGIYSDGGSASGGYAGSLQGTYNPWLHDMYISGMTSHGLITPYDARWANPDRYSCADVTCERVTITSCGGWGIYNPAFATAWKIRSPYIVSNIGGGIYSISAQYELRGGAVAGNGSAADPASAGIHIARTADGTPEDAEISHCEIDGNYNRQIRNNGINTHVHHNRFVDAVVAGAFRCPTQVETIAINGQSADSSLIEYNAFRFDDQAAVNVTAISFNLDVADGSRTAKYNVARRNRYNANGATSGVVTPVYFGANPNSVYSIGNVDDASIKPLGDSYAGAATRDISTASGTQVITGVGFRPRGLSFMGIISGTTNKTEGYCSTDLVNVGVYFYQVAASYYDNGTNRSITIRTAAGDIYDGYVSATSDDGFTITWTKTGSPTGTLLIKFLATK